MKNSRPKIHRKYSNPWDPLGDALKDFHDAGKSSDLIVLSDFEIPVTMKVGKFFRASGEFPEIEHAALSLCNGPVLDLGAGAGCHVLALQDMGCDVIGVDISPDAVEVMKSRGVVRAVCGDVYTLTRNDISAPDGVDTILMLMNGIGLAGNTDGLNRFLINASELLKPEGKLIFDSVDLRKSCPEHEITAREADEDRDYFGEIRYRFNYRGETGPEFSWLYIDPDLLEEVAGESGWHIDVIYPHSDGHYLAQMSVDF